MSPATTKNGLFILFLLSCNVLQALSVTCRFTRGYRIHVVNKLPPNSQLQLHCASGDDDLGYHTTPVGYDFTWRFCNTFTRRTLFFCTLHWGSKKKSFDVFDSSWAVLCKEQTCRYEARSDGIYFSGKKSPTFADWKKYYNWE